MARGKKRDCWTASVRISIPIDATDPMSIDAAQKSVKALANLLPGSSVEITHAGFGRMAAPAPAPTLDMMSALREAVKEPEIPDSLRRVPRYDNGPDAA